MDGIWSFIFNGGRRKSEWKVSSKKEPTLQLKENIGAAAETVGVLKKNRQIEKKIFCSSQFEL